MTQAERRLLRALAHEALGAVGLDEVREALRGVQAETVLEQPDQSSLLKSLSDTRSALERARAALRLIRDDPSVDYSIHQRAVEGLKI